MTLVLLFFLSFASLVYSNEKTENRFLQLILTEIQRLDNVLEVDQVILEAQKRRKELVPSCGAECSASPLENYLSDASESKLQGSEIDEEDLFPHAFTTTHKGYLYGMTVVSLRLPGRQPNVNAKARFLNLVVTARENSLLFFDSAQHNISLHTIPTTSPPTSLLVSTISKEPALIVSFADGSIQLFHVKAWIESSESGAVTKLTVLPDPAFNENALNFGEVQQLAVYHKGRDNLFYVASQDRLRVVDRTGVMVEDLQLNSSMGFFKTMIVTENLNQKSVLSTEKGLLYLKSPHLKWNPANNIAGDFCPYTNLTKEDIGYFSSLAYDVGHPYYLWLGTDSGRVISVYVKTKRATCQVKTEFLVEKNSPLRILPVHGYLFISSLTRLYIYNVSSDFFYSPSLVSFREFTPSAQPLLISSMATVLGDEYVGVASNATEDGGESRVTIYRSLLPTTKSSGGSWFPTRLPILLIAILLVALYQWWKRRDQPSIFSSWKNRRKGASSLASKYASYNTDLADSLRDPQFAQRIRELDRLRSTPRPHSSRGNDLWNAKPKGGLDKPSPFDRDARSRRAHNYEREDTKGGSGNEL